MTGSPEFPEIPGLPELPGSRNQPQPEDWRLPDAIAAQRDRMDPVQWALLNEGDIDGVPAPLYFQRGEVFTGRIDRLDAGEDPDALADEILADAAAQAARYPDSGFWDGERSTALIYFAERGHVAAAVRLAREVTDARRLVRSIYDLGETAPPETAQAMVVGVLRGASVKRTLAITRATRDYFIETDPLNENVARFDGFVAKLSGQGPYDMVEDWLASQAEASPDGDWSSVAVHLRDDVLYQGMAMPVRMHSHLVYLETLAEADNLQPKQLQDGWAGKVAEYYAGFQEGAYAEAGIWGHELAGISTVLIRNGHLDAAVTLAATIRDPQLGTAMVGEFLRAGHESSAIEAASRNPDPRLAAKLLLGFDFSDPDAATAKLTEMMFSDEYPLDRRIGCMEFVCDRMLEMDDLDGFLRYREMINELRGEQP
ncbi:MAG TPA: hypothetical protein VLF71_02585 [Candidatus Saccharimonadales bacterium]|nr:hypothetical protein [Candidatus Saccharimonadales bacterium]